MAETKTQSKLSWWPSPQDYNEAIQHLHGNVEDPQLRRGQVDLTALGLPRPLCGAFASVYKVRSGNQNFAVRCFLRDIRDQQQRYKFISEFVQNDTLPYTVTFDFLQQGILVNGKWCPILKMDWVEGLNLDLYVEKHLRSPHIERLAQSFKIMCKELAEAGIAHGDLQHGNIIVCKGDELRLVDYDGMFVPAMKGMHANEIGHRNYQHPRRAAQDFGAHLDNFAAWVIYASLRALSIDPDLYDQLGAGDDCLLFRRDDFVEPEHSYTFALLEHHPNEEVRALTKFLRFHCRQPLEKVPPLGDTVPAVPQLAPLPVEVAATGVRHASHNSGGTGLPDWMDPGEVSAATVAARRQPKAPPARMPDALGAQHAVSMLGKPYSRQGQKSQQQVAAAPAPTQNIPTQIEPELVQQRPRYVIWDERHGSRPEVSQKLMLANPLVWLMFAGYLNPGLWGLAIFCICINLIIELCIWIPALKDRGLAHGGDYAKTLRLVTSESTDSEGATTYWVEYEFKVPGKPKRQYEKKWVSREEYEFFKHMNIATVLYDRSQPSHNVLYPRCKYKAIDVQISPDVEPELQLRGTRKVKFNDSRYVSPNAWAMMQCCSPFAWMMFAGGAVAAVGFMLTAFITWLIYRLPLRDKDLALNGLPARARIVNVYVAPEGPTIEYTFQSYKGKVSTLHKVSQAAFDKISQGDVVTVLYDPHDPQSNVIYDWSHYKVM